jgi:Cellulase (glycosyl hydrolase family 5)
LRLGSLRLSLVSSAAQAATALAVSAVVALALVAPDPAAAASSRAAQAGDAITVQGNQLLRGGAVWFPRGVQIVGLVAPDVALSGKYVDAHAHFGAAELRAVRAHHADTVRFQVSQYGLDPLDPLHSSQYVQEVRGGIQLARSSGLNVIISMQAQGPAGAAQGQNCPLPSTGAERAWNQIAPMFAGDPGVMFELYNEPSLGLSFTNWQLWLNGGFISQQDGMVCQEVGMQALINDIRQDGAGNVIIVPGLAAEFSLAGMPPVTDPANPFNPQLAYGVHYPSLEGGPGAWNSEFAKMSQTEPVIVTEWYASSVANTNTPHCVAGESVLAAELLAYLASKQIGVVGYAFDVPGTIVSGWSYAPTTYDHNFACGVPGEGPGQLLFDDYAGLEQADGPSVNNPPGWIVGYNEMQRLLAQAPGNAHHFFDSPRTFVVGASAPTLRRLGLAAIPTASFTSESALAKAINRHQLRSGTGAVMYAPQHSRFATPRAEQLHPDTYTQRAARVAHSHGVLLVAAPAANLVAARAPKTPAGGFYNQFLKQRIAPQMARYADSYAIQADGLATHRSSYVKFVQAVALQAAGAHPAVELLTGVSGSALSKKQSANLLLNAVLAVGNAVSAYWLDDPSRTQGCPRCTSAAATLLHGLRARGL